MEKTKKSGPELGKTIFTICYYFKFDPQGREYTISEINQKKHRRYWPSFDYIETRQGFKITDHRRALITFIKSINEQAKDGNIFSGYVKAEREQKVIFNFAADGKPRYIHFPEFIQKGTGTILNKLILNVTVVTPAVKPLPLYNGINSPEKAKYYQRAELYREMSSNYKPARLSDKLRAQIGT